MNKYIVINSEDIQKRIEELKKPIAHYDGIYVSDEQIAEYEALEEILSNSKPLEEELGKAFEAGVDIKWKGILIKKEEIKVQKQDYINNLKLDI